MKAYRKLILVMITIFLFLALCINVYLVQSRQNAGKKYKVDINRISIELEKKDTSFFEGKNVDNWFDSKDYPNIIKLRFLPISQQNTNEFEQFLMGQDVPNSNQYVIFHIKKNGKVMGYCRGEYESPSTNYFMHEIVLCNIVLVVAFFVVTGILFYLRSHVFKPFLQMSDAPVQLAKGHYSQGMKEQKSKYFGRFIWGMDMLRNTLQDSKDRELEMEKEQKMMILSISHDIKTPLSAIRLYSKALKDGLYTSPTKVDETYDKIDEKVMQIEGMVTSLISMSTSNIRNIEVNNSEFYLGETVEQLKNNYMEKCKIRHIDLSIGTYTERMLHGDVERLQEVLENLLENAIKYGDGRYIQVTFEEEEYCQLIRVVNSGKPLRPDDYVHMFDSFWRGENAGNKPGSGLGLYICKTIMNKMNGDIFPEKRDGDEFSMVLVLS